MSNELPNYVASATPVPQANRVPWYLSTAQTYAGIMLWFVFWQDVPVGKGLSGPYSAFAGGTLSHGIFLALGGLILAALICHFLFYLVPGLLGLKTGLPLYIVGTSTYGVHGGFLMPGFLMGVLQFGWLGVNAYFSSKILCETLGYAELSMTHRAVAAVFAIAAAFIGLKGIRYVAWVNTFAPIIPLVTLVLLVAATFGGISNFDPHTVVQAGLDKAVTIDDKTVHAAAALSAPMTVAWILTYVVGFFATAGAAGVDFGMNNRNARDVHLGGLVGVALSTIVAGGLAILIVAGAHGSGKAPDGATLQTVSMLGILGPTASKILLWLLALVAFPSACFSSLIAANSFKTTLPKVNPFISVGLGTLASIILAYVGWAGNAAGVFTIIGASFGPICGAMMADYLLSGCKWNGPRAGFNPAGWISWAVGFVVGAANFIPGMFNIIPAPPVAAFVVGFLLYVILAKIGLQSRTLEMPAKKD
jgi:cytosine permease